MRRLDPPNPVLLRGRQSHSGSAPGSVTGGEPSWPTPTTTTPRTDTATDEVVGTPESTEAGLEQGLSREEESPLAETFNVPDSDLPESTDEDDEEIEEPVAEPAPEPIAEAHVEPEPEPEPETEPELPRFAAPFSSPEPTAVVARPRRRATRPALSADPDSVEAPSLPRRRPRAGVRQLRGARRRRPGSAAAPRPPSGRVAGGSDDVETEARVDAGADTEVDEDEAPRSRRSRSRGRRPAADRTETVEDDSDTDTDTDEDSEDERRGPRRGHLGQPPASPRTPWPRPWPHRRGLRRRRRRDRRRRRRRPTPRPTTPSDDEAGEDTDDEAEGGSSTRRRRRRRRRGGSTGEAGSDDVDDDDRPERAGRNGRTTSDDDVRGVAGSTRLEAKRQRRRDGRDTGRRRAPILTESEFLARREAVDRKMVIRQRGERTQIAVLEDEVLVEHYVTQASATSFAGNVYLGRVQNVLPSMEAAFVDIGKGRNAVLYAGEVNWDAAGLSGKQRSIETALKSGDKVLVQVTKDPIGHKGARLTQQINLPGRFLVYVPGGSMTGISRKLPDTERQRLKDILKKIVPEDAGVIIRTAAEGASEEELTRDVNRLTAQWDVISKKAESTTNAPTLLYGEPDLAIRVIRDVFNEDFKELVVQGDDAWDTVEAYVGHVSPELTGRLTRFTAEGDVFRDLRIDEQLAKALDRKVWLPSGGSLVIDRTEAMTVVDVNTGKFTGSGGNLEQTVTRNNMEAAEEIVRQLRLRDIGGIIVIDFIDMVLESNRDLVLRRLTECLGRDRTKHQVAEVTSLGLVQMTRKRVGQGLLEVFSEPCEHCRGRGVLVHTDPVDERRRGGSGGGSGWLGRLRAVPAVPGAGTAATAATGPAAKDTAAKDAAKDVATTAEVEAVPPRPTPGDERADRGWPEPAQPGPPQPRPVRRGPGRRGRCRPRRHP